MATSIKICGLSTETAISAAIAAGANHIGLVHFAGSPRHVTLERARELASHADRRAKVVLLLVDADPVLTARALDMVRPDIVQLHGRESRQWAALIRSRGTIGVWKAWGVRNPQSLEDADAWAGAIDLMLYDAPAGTLPGGNGTTFDWSLLSSHRHVTPWGLAGGLTPATVGLALAATGAPLVDVSSGVESAPGVKDVDKIAAFCQAVRDHDSAKASA